MVSSKMEKKPLVESYWFWVLVIVVVGGLFVFFKVNLPASPAGGPADQSQLVLDFGNGEVRQFQGLVIPGMTVLDVLNSASLGGNFDFRYSIDDDGTLKVAKIGDIANLADRPSWHFYLNGKPINVGDLGHTTIKAGDQIEAKYESR